MLDKLKQDQVWTAAVILLYLCPFFIWLSFAMSEMGPGRSWTLFAVGLLMSLAGSAALILMKRPAVEIESSSMEEALPEAALPEMEQPESVSQSLQSIDTQANSKVDDLHNEVLKLQEENISLKNQNFQVMHAYNALKKEMEEMEGRPQSQDPQALKQIEHQKTVIEQYEVRIMELENRIEDLQYEMSAILNLKDSDLSIHE